MRHTILLPLLCAGLLCIGTPLTVDRAAALAPDIPSNPVPSNGSSGVAAYLELQWTAGTPGPGENFTFDIYFGTDVVPPLVAQNITDTRYNPGVLDSLTIYYWQIVAYGAEGSSAVGPVWHFTTVDNQPPFAPRIIKATPFLGPKITVDYSTVSADPEGDLMNFQWDWGDGRLSDWLGPCLYGEELTTPNQWPTDGNYSVRVRAQDSHGRIGDWSESTLVTVAPQLSMSMLRLGYASITLNLRLGTFPRNYAYIPLLEKYGMGAIISIGVSPGFTINATYKPSVRSVMFSFQNLFTTTQEIKILDDNLSNGCSANYDINSGLYRVTVTAYDADGTIIDVITKEQSLYLHIPFDPISRIQGIRASRAV